MIHMRISNATVSGFYYTLCTIICILNLMLYDTLMMVTRVTETCCWITIIYVIGHIYKCLFVGSLYKYLSWGFHFDVKVVVEPSGFQYFALLKETSVSFWRGSGCSSPQHIHTHKDGGNRLFSMFSTTPIS